MVYFTRTEKFMDINTLLWLPKKIIAAFEDDSIPFRHYLFTFLAATVLRNFIEAFSQYRINYFNSENLFFATGIVHLTLSYITIAMLMTLLFYYATGETVKKIAKVILPSMLMLVMAPTLDLIVTGGAGCDIAYFINATYKDLFKNYISYCSYYPKISLGMRIEVLIYLCGFYSYFRIKGRSLTASLLYTLLGYTLLFGCACLPIVNRFLMNMLGFHYHFSSSQMVECYALIIFVLAAWLLFLGYKQWFRIIVSCINLLYVAYGSVLLLLGFALGCSINQQSVIAVINNDPSLLNAFIFLNVSLILINVFYRVHPETNLWNCSIPGIPACKQLSVAYVALGGSIFYAALVGAKVCYLLGFIAACFYIYLMPPILLKRVFIFSKVVLAVCSFALLLAGYILQHNNSEFFPKSVGIACLLLVTIGANLLSFLSRNLQSYLLLLVILSGTIWTYYCFYLSLAIN